MIRETCCVSVAFASGGDIQSWNVHLAADEREQVEQLLGWIFQLGHVAAFAITDMARPVDIAAVLQNLRERLGHVVVDAVSGCSLSLPDPKPSYLVPVWSFDDERDGFPAASARFLNTDVEVSAVPSFDEEVGFSLPGRQGLWLPLLFPFSAYT